MARTRVPCRPRRSAPCESDTPRRHPEWEHVPVRQGTGTPESGTIAPRRSCAVGIKKLGLMKRAAAQEFRGIFTVTHVPVEAIEGCIPLQTTGRASPPPQGCAIRGSCPPWCCRSVHWSRRVVCGSSILTEGAVLSNSAHLFDIPGT